jgi:hypothetical protein
LLIAVGALLAFLLVLEVVLARTHWFGARRSYVRPDPFLRYRFEPNAHYWFHQENDHPITGQINAAGWRDRPRSLEAHPGVYRVAVLGDSYVEALQVEQDSMFTIRTEESLNQRAEALGAATRFEVLNFGCSGFTQSEEWLVLLQDVPKYKPDLIALFFYPGNDIRDIHPKTSPTLRPFFTLNAADDLILDVGFRDTRSYKVRRWLNPIQQQSALISLVVSRLVTQRQARQIETVARAEKAAGERLVAHHSLAGSHPDPRYAENYALCKRLIARMVEFCRSNDTRFLLVCMPDTYQTDEADSLRSIDPAYDLHYFARDLEQFAASLQVDFLSLQEPFAQASARGEDLRWLHWNYAGHRLVANELGAVIQRLAPLE